MNKYVYVRLASFLLSAVSLCAQANLEAPCNNLNLKGAFGVMVNGTAPASTVLPGIPSTAIGTLEQFLTVVVHNFDGEGGFTQLENAKGSLSGPVLGRAGAGTYTVNRDCSGSYSLFIPGLSFPVVVVRFVIVDGGKEFRGIVFTPQEAMVTANGRKMH